MSNSGKPKPKATTKLFDLIKKDYAFLVNATPIIFVTSVIFSITVFAIREVNHNWFFVSGYVHDILVDGTKNREAAYLVAFLIPFFRFFSASYFILWYFCDLRLKASLNDSGCLTDIPKLEKIKNIFFNSGGVGYFNVYPIQTINRLIENGEIKKREGLINLMLFKNKNTIK